jgi:hypothetical protein
MSQEKIYTINVMRDGRKEPEALKLKESELTDAHIDLFHGQLMKTYNDSPKTAQDRHKRDLSVDDAMYAEMRAQDKCEHDTCMKLLNVVRILIGEELVDDIKQIIEDSDSTGGYEITAEPRGKLQEENYDFVKEMWVEQHSVGDTGDSWAGHVSVKIKDGMFFTFSFSI